MTSAVNVILPHTVQGERTRLYKVGVEIDFREMPSQLQRAHGIENVSESEKIVVSVGVSSTKLSQGTEDEIRGFALGRAKELTEWSTRLIEEEL